MKEEELIRKLEEVELPQIELESHQSRLRMALLNSDSFEKIRGGTTLEKAQKIRRKPFFESFGGELFQLRPVWKYSIGLILLLGIIFITVFSIPSLGGPEKASLIPEGGHRLIDGPKLSIEKEEKVKDILSSDSEIQELLASGAVIESIMPIVVTMQGVNSETGEREEITYTESMAQVWITRGEKQWGAVVDLMQEKVISISD